jgi:DNA topoisomerase IA
VLDFQTEKKKGSSRSAKAGEDGSEEEQQALPAGLARGQAQEVLDAEAMRKKTRAPKRFTEATLLTAMETDPRETTATAGSPRRAIWWTRRSRRRQHNGM